MQASSNRKVFVEVMSYIHLLYLTSSPEKQKHSFYEDLPTHTSITESSRSTFWVFVVDKLPKR